jgi:hypothetical protein
MRIVELLNTLKMPISNEEADLLDKFATLTEIAKHELNDREQVIANKLVERDVLTRRNNNGKITYTKKIRD